MQLLTFFWMRIKQQASNAPQAIHIAHITPAVVLYDNFISVLFHVALTSHLLSLTHTKKRGKNKKEQGTYERVLKSTLAHSLAPSFQRGNSRLY